jgi:N-acetylglucosamine-6-phosphate deacetylase
VLTALTGARLITPDQDVARGTVVIENGRIVEAGADVRPPPRATIVELNGHTLAPGLIDLHVHGGGGFALATRDPEELRDYARWVAAFGVTGFLASIVAATAEDAIGPLQAVAEANGPIEGGATLLGAHLEGPFVNPERRGALPEGWPRPPDPSLLRRLLEAAGGRLRLLTVAPELPGADEVIAVARDAGCAVALGHTDATYEQARAAFAAGARHVTHAFNAMRPFHQREPGTIGAALERPDVTLELIADGVHVHPAAARLLIAAAGASRVALITDAVPPAGAPETGFLLGGELARLEGGRVTLPDGTIAGSAATMDSVVRNVVEWGAAPMAAAVRMASTVPARVLGLDRAGRLAAGYDADLVALDGEMSVVTVWVGGRIAHDASSHQR